MNNVDEKFGVSWEKFEKERQRIRVGKKIENK